MSDSSDREEKAAQQPVDLRSRLALRPKEAAQRMSAGASILESIRRFMGGSSMLAAQK